MKSELILRAKKSSQEKLGMNKILRTLPLLVMFFISLALAMGLFNKDTSKLVDTLHNGKKFVDFEVKTLGRDTMFSPKLFGKGRVVMVNVFASWCVPCVQEHALLMNLSQKIDIYGVAWKDSPEAILRYLQSRGNPFVQVAVDEAGTTTIPMALTGVPETFILDRNGAIALHYKAMLNEDSLKTLILPLIEKLNSENEPAS